MSLLHITASRGGESGGTPALAWSAPSGLGDYNEMTITTDGTYGFGTKSNAAPMYLWDIGRDATTTIADLSVTPFSSSSYSRKSKTLYVGEIIASDQCTNSSYTMRNDMSVVSGCDSISDLLGVGGADYLDISADSAGSEMIIFQKHMQNTSTVDGEDSTYGCPASGNGMNFKAWRLWAWNGNITYPDIYYGRHGPDAESTKYGNPAIAIENDAAQGNYELTSEWVFAQWSRIEPFGTSITNNNLWNTQFIRYEQNSAVDQSDGVFKIMAGGQNVVRTGLITSETSSAGLQPTRLAFPQVERGMVSLDDGITPAYHHWDIIYIDDSLHCVAITDQSTWDDTNTGSSQVELAIPTSWSDTSVTVRMRQGEHDSLSGKYLYVLDGTGTPVTPTGVAL